MKFIAQVEALLAEGGTRLPPVDSWQPALSGDIDIRIARDGRWYHEGGVFERESLMRLFASILRREGDDHFLVTPVEKWRIRVDCTPFVAIDVEVVGAGEEQQLVFLTNVGDRVHCNPEHPLRTTAVTSGGERLPLLRVRGGLDARLASSVYYRLVEQGVVVERDNEFGLWSGGVFFPQHAG